MKFSSVESIFEFIFFKNPNELRKANKHKINQPQNKEQCFTSTLGNEQKWLNSTNMN